MRRLFSTLLMATCVCELAVAQPGQSERIAYDAAFFAQFSPRTALDMVQRVPGFAIEDGEERRGFAGAQGNILIDGEAPVSKSQDIEDVLGRIPARDVVRIELIRGAGSSAGSSRAARVNVVRRPGTGDGVWEIELAHTRDGRVTPSGEAAWSGRQGDLEYGISGAIDLERLPIRGERTDYDANGAIDERRAERIPTDEREGRLTGELSFPLSGGTLAMNSQLSRAELNEREFAALFSAGGAGAGSIDTDLVEREDVGELGVSYRRNLGDWRSELAAVITRRRFESEEVTAERDAIGAFDEGAQQTQRIDSGETILRLQARRDLWRGWRIEVGAEAALNTLEQRLTLSEDDGSGPVAVTLPSANVTVEEQRGEASLMLAGALAPGWTLEGGAAVETSVLTQSGDASRDTKLTYWKPSVQLTRALGERNQLRARLYRDVSQLDFEDFVSAADITSSIVNAGNPDLRPETSWRLELSGDWRFAEDGAVSVTFYRWWVEDALDIIPVGPIGNQLDAPGNIGEADVMGVRASLSLPLPFDSEFRLEGFAQDAEATDPLTGERRSISAFDESVLTIGFRQDLAQAAWGIEFEREREAPAWRLDRVENEQDADELTFWVETTAFANVKLRAWATNLAGSRETRERRIFDPTRLDAFAGSDARAREEGVTIGVSASGSF